MKSTRIAVRVVLLSTMLLSCNGNEPSVTIPPDEPTVAAPKGVVISDPSATSFTASRSAARSANAAYIAASPGSLSNATTVTIRNRTRNGSPSVVPVINGGFDPVAIEAEVGDEVTLEIVTPSGISISTVKVPPRRTPSVVRTNPSKGRSDVALSVQIEVVFSEPIDKTTVTAAAITLTTGGAAVPGKLAISDDGLYVSFAPESPLQPGVSYSLTVSNNVRDQTGDPLETPDTVTFTTLSDPSSNQAIAQFAFLSERDGNTEIYTSTSEGADVVRLTTNSGYDGEIAWSPDGNRIAFVSQRGPALGDTRDVYIMNADGSNVTRLTTTGHTSHPTWSPDGRQIAYVYNESSLVFGNTNGDIAIIDVEKGEVSRRYLGLSSVSAAEPVWFPDGTRIAFLADRGFYDAWRRVLTVKPDGTSVETFLDGAGQVFFSSPEFSRDGTRLAVDYCTGNDALVQCVTGAGILLASYPAGNLTYWMDRRAMHNSPQYAAGFHPTWSPDGNNLAFSVWRCSGCGGTIASGHDGVNIVYLIDNAHDAEWRPRN